MCCAERDGVYISRKKKARVRYEIEANGGCDSLSGVQKEYQRTSVLQFICTWFLILVRMLAVMPRL